MKKTFYLLLCLMAFSCSPYANHGLISSKKPTAKSKSYYSKVLRGNKPLFQKYKKGTSTILRKQQNDWQYSRSRSATHRKSLTRSGGYSD